MRISAIICASLSGPAAAEVIACDLSGVPVQFEIDETQFAPPQDPNDPPRRKTTTVQMGDARFPAEPIVMGDVRGFWAEGVAGSNVMLVVQDDGTAIYSDTRAGQQLTGTCEVLQ
jgi:hypothetical protein